MESEITYEVQAEDGFVEKRWKIVTYPLLENLDEAKRQYQNHCQQNPKMKFRLVKVTKKEIE